MSDDLQTDGWRRAALIGWLIGYAVTAQGLPVSGTISYVGTQGPVSATLPIQVSIFDQPIGVAGSKPVAVFTVSTSPGAFAFAVSAGTYYLAYWLAVIPDGLPDIGEPFQLYNQQFLPPGNALNVSGSGVTGLSLTFDDTGILSGIGGTVTYNGTLGSVSNNSRLVVDRFSDPTVAGPPAGQTNVKANGARYDLITFDTNTWYLVAYLDVNNNRTRDAGEPYSIYNDRSSPPAKPVVAGTTQTAIDITFGDENIGSGPTATPSMPVAATPTVTATPTRSPPLSCVGDCNGDSRVTADEVFTLAAIALSNADASACSGGIPGGVEVNIALVVQAVNNALSGCGTPVPTGTPVTHTVEVGPNGMLVFSPSSLSIHVGETVMWMWSSSGHSVVSGSECATDGQFCSPNDSNCAQAPLSSQGTTYSRTFTAAGIYPYFCSQHCGFGMAGTITVQ